MKDKLVKYHHKAIYYRMKKTLVALSFVFGAAVAFTIPVSIALAINNESPLAENITSATPSTDNSSANQTSVE